MRYRPIKPRKSLDERITEAVVKAVQPLRNDINEIGITLKQ